MTKWLNRLHIARYWRKDRGKDRSDGKKTIQLLGEHKENKGCWELKEKTLDDTLWRTRFGRGYGPVVRQTTERMKERMNVTEFFWIIHTRFGLLTMKMVSKSLLLCTSLHVVTSEKSWIFNNACWWYLFIRNLAMSFNSKRMGWECSMKWVLPFRNGIVERQTLIMGYIINVYLSVDCERFGFSCEQVSVAFICEKCIVLGSLTAQSNTRHWDYGVVLSVYYVFMSLFIWKKRCIADVVYKNIIDRNVQPFPCLCLYIPFHHNSLHRT